jgi:tripartite motif-containing protein 71
MRDCSLVCDRGSRWTRWMVLAIALMGSMLLSWGSPQRAGATFFEEKPGVEKPLPYGEGEVGPVLYLEPGGSGVQTSPKVYVIFWGSNFEKTETGEKVRAMLLKLYEGMTGSAYEGILTQYFNSTGGLTGRVGSTVTTTSWIDKSVTAPTKVNEAKINGEIESAIGTNGWTTEMDAQFVLAIAPGATYEPSLDEDCAYHYVTPSGAIYDFIPYQGDEPFAKECLELGNPSKNPIYKTSKSASHEFAEAATDPEGDTWGGDEHEVADLCVKDEDFELPDHAWAQKLYDDSKNECSKEDLDPPHVYTITEAASSVTSTNATLNGIVNPEAESPETHYYFEVSTSESYGTRSMAVGAGLGAKNIEVKQSICGLAASTPYDFRVAATNSTGTAYGKSRSFTTSASGGSGCPSATTEAASNVKTIESTLNGTVNPDGLATKYHFEYGTTASYGKTTSEASAGSGTSNVKKSQTATGLSGGTEYHFRIVATNSIGTTYGGDKTFKTSTISPPTVTTGSATDITETRAVLNGTVDPEGSATKYYFVYGTEEEKLTSKTAEASAGSGTSSLEVSEAVTGLAASTTYYFRIVATNGGGTREGAEQSFATSAKPTVETWSGEDVGETTATLSGAVNPEGAEAKYYFEYGTSEAYGSKTAEASLSSGTTNVEVSKEITGLLRNTTYYFRIAATNVNGTTYGSAETLTTLSPVTTGSATGITATEAVLHGTVNPHGLATTDQFEYGLTTSYGTTVPASAESAGSGTAEVSKGYILTGLKPDTTYHFRLVGTNSEGATDGKDATFATAAVTVEFVSSFGSVGKGDGEFREPTGIAVSPINGNVVVSDEANNRVQVFNEKGEFVRTFGSEGTGNGQFKEPRGVAVDSKGDVWVADTGNDRVEEFNETGAYLGKLGVAGTGNGDFEEPKSVAVDSKGDVWVADSGNGRVEEFGETRAYVRQFSAGTNPVGVAVDSKGNVWSDNEDETGAIEEHNEKGESVRKFASRGEGNGDVAEPKRLIVDANGYVWIADAGNDRIDVFNEKGEYVTKFGTDGSGSEEMINPTGVAVDIHGRVWVADDENNRVDKWRIAALHPAFSSAFGSLGAGDGEFDEPVGIAVNPIDGNVVVSDEKNNRVQVFNEKGEFVRTFGSEGTGNGQFKEPRGVAVDSKGDVWVADTGNDRVEEFNETGAYLGKLGVAGTGNGDFEEPKSVAVDSKGDVWVADSGNGRVEEFGETRAYVRQFSAGTNPVGVAVDSKGNVWSDNEDETRAIEEHNEKGVFVQGFATRGQGTGQVHEPRRLSVDSAGDVWVPDAANNRVVVFSEKGEFLTQFGAKGSGSEEMIDPTGVAVDRSGNVWVADAGNNRVDRWIR